MGAPRKAFLASAACGVAVAVLWTGSVWSAKAQGGPSSPRPPVSVLKDRPKAPPVTDGDRGTTYHTLERQATRVTTTFASFTVDGERTADGQLRSRVLDAAGNELGTLRVHPAGAASDTIEYAASAGGDGGTLRAARRADLRPTLDWANAQAYSLWRDRGGLASGALEWQDSMMRPRGAARRDVRTEALRIKTEFKDGFTAEVSRKTATHISYVTNQTTTGVVYQSVLRQDGVDVGFSQWWPSEQAFAWSFPALNANGYVTAARLQNHGGWPFAPDMAWLNMQNLALQQFGTLLKAKGTVARNQGGGWLGRFVDLVAPTAKANEPGCDTQHWLDGTILRWCCDVHDFCYEAYSCNAGSWWVWNWWSSWQCDRCNFGAVSCFFTGGTGHRLVWFP